MNSRQHEHFLSIVTKNICALFQKEMIWNWNSDNFKSYIDLNSESFELNTEFWKSVI